MLAKIKSLEDLGNKYDYDVFDKCIIFTLNSDNDITRMVCVSRYFGDIILGNRRQIKTDINNNFIDMETGMMVPKEFIEEIT